MHVLDTAQISHGQVSISPCNDMVAASGFTPEVHLWAVQFGKSATSNPFQQVRTVRVVYRTIRVMTLCVKLEFSVYSC